MPLVVKGSTLLLLVQFSTNKFQFYLGLWVCFRGYTIMQYLLTASRHALYTYSELIISLSWNSHISVFFCYYTVYSSQQLSIYKGVCPPMFRYSDIHVCVHIWPDIWVWFHHGPDIQIFRCVSITVKIFRCESTTAQIFRCDSTSTLV